MNLIVKPGQTTKNTALTKRQEGKNMRHDAWPDFYLMKIISIIHVTAGGLCRQSQQTITHTV